MLTVCAFLSCHILVYSESTLCSCLKINSVTLGQFVYYLSNSGFESRCSCYADSIQSNKVSKIY